MYNRIRRDYQQIDKILLRDIQRRELWWQYTLSLSNKKIYNRFSVWKLRFQVLSELIVYSRLSLSRNRRDPQKHVEISVLRHIRLVVLRKKTI